MLEELRSGWREEAGQGEEDRSFDPLKRYLADVSKYSMLSKEEELAVAERAYRLKDKEACQRLVTSNLRLVVKIALQYQNAYLNLLDVIQEGNMGLVHAVKKYDPARGTRFSTYSSFWIRAYILKYLMDSWSIVKIGTSQGQRKLFYRLNKEKKKLEADGIFPSTQVLAGLLNVNAKEVEEMEKRLACSDISLDTPLYDGGEETLGTVLAADESIEETIAAKEKKAILEEKIGEFKKTLSTKELFIFEERFAKEEPITLQEIGHRISISRERVRQLESRIVKKFSDQFQEQFRKLDL